MILDTEKKVWTDLSLFDRTAKLVQGCSDVEFLCKDPHLLNLPLWDTQIAIIKDFYGGDLYQNPYIELVLVAGMASSKTFILSVFGAIEIFKFMVMDIRGKYSIHPSSPVFGLCVAGKEEQGKDTVFAQLKSRIVDSPYLSALKPTIYTDTIYFPKNFTVRLISSKSTTETGRRCTFILVDEADKFETTEGVRSGEEVSRLLSKSTATFKRDGHRFWAGSPMAPQSFLMRKYRQGLEIKGTLSILKATWELNPNISRADLEEDFRRDPIGALRDYAADPTSGTNLYFRNQEIFKWSEKPNMLLQLAEGIDFKPEQFEYIVAGDPALKSDSFGLAIGHKRGKNIIIDGLFRFSPKGREIDPLEVRDFLFNLFTKVQVREVAFDVWWFPELQREIKQKGIKVINHQVTKSDYDLFKGLLYEKQIEMCYYEPIQVEISTVILTDSGKVDHPRGGSKDILDACVLCVRELAEKQTSIPILAHQVV